MTTYVLIDEVDKDGNPIKLKIEHDRIRFLKNDNPIGWWDIYHAHSNNIKKVIFNCPATIIFWDDGSKTLVKCTEKDTFDYEKGLAMAIAKKNLGNDFRKTFKKWLPKEPKKIEHTLTVLFNAYEKCQNELEKTRIQQLYNIFFIEFSR